MVYMKKLPLYSNSVMKLFNCPFCNSWHRSTLYSIEVCLCETASAAKTVGPIPYNSVSVPTPWAVAGPHGQLASIIFCEGWCKTWNSVVALTLKKELGWNANRGGDSPHTRYTTDVDRYYYITRWNMPYILGSTYLNFPIQFSTLVRPIEEWSLKSRNGRHLYN